MLTSQGSSLAVSIPFCTRAVLGHAESRRLELAGCSGLSVRVCAVLPSVLAVCNTKRANYYNMYFLQLLVALSKLRSRTSSAPKVYNETPFETCLRGNAPRLFHASLCRVCKQPRKELLWIFMLKNKQRVGPLSDIRFFLPCLTWSC